MPSAPAPQNWNGPPPPVGAGPAAPGFGPHGPTAGVAAKSAGVAVLLSFLWLGAGHLYANKVGVGVALMLYNFVLVLLALTVAGLVVALPLWLISTPIIMILAANAATRFNERNGFVVR